MRSTSGPSRRCAVPETLLGSTHHLSPVRTESPLRENLRLSRTGFLVHRLTSNGPLLGGDGKERTGHHAVRPAGHPPRAGGRGRAGRLLLPDEALAVVPYPLPSRPLDGLTAPLFYELSYATGARG